MSNNNIFLKSGFLRVPLQNGVGRYVCQLQRIVFKFCKNNGSSRGMRDFIENDLVRFAQEQPGVVVYVKPRRHRSPVIVGEYLNGQRQWMSAHNMTREEVLRWTGSLLGASDASGLRYRKPWSTLYPSIQGPWSPFNKLGEPLPEDEPSAAYTRLLELAKEQGITNES